MRLPKSVSPKEIVHVNLSGNLLFLRFTPMVLIYKAVDSIWDLEYGFERIYALLIRFIAPLMKCDAGSF